MKRRKIKTTKQKKKKKKLEDWNEQTENERRRSEINQLNEHFSKLPYILLFTILFNLSHLVLYILYIFIYVCLSTFFHLFRTIMVIRPKWDLWASKVTKRSLMYKFIVLLFYFICISMYGLYVYMNIDIYLYIMWNTNKHILT